MKKIFIVLTAMLAFICSNTVSAQADDAPYEVMDVTLNGNFKVKGTPNVKSFMEALPVYMPEYGWEKGAVIDIKNGYFKQYTDGGGQTTYYGAVWNRNDGKKLFIFSYRISNIAEHPGHTKAYTLVGGSKSFYVAALKLCLYTCQNTAGRRVPS